MHYAVMAPVASQTTADPQWIAGYARHAEACGFESIMVVEHPVVGSRYSSTYPYDKSGKMGLPDDCPIPDPLDLLAFLAGHTTTLGLATGVLVLPTHHPVTLAKRAATVDRLSGGRLRLGVGVGWMREEVEACGADFATRGTRVDESIAVLRTLWADSGPEGASHEGRFFCFAGVMSYPKPARAIPIHIGGHSRAAARRAGRLGDGLQPLGLTGTDLDAAVRLMREEAERAGRDPDALELTLGDTVAKISPERAGKLAAAGADRVLLAPGWAVELERAKDELSECAQRLGLSPA